MSRLIEKHRLLKEAVDEAIAQTTGFDGLAADVLSEVVLQTIHTYQQKINVGVQDSVGDIMDSFKQKVSEAVFDTARGWRIANRDSFIFPRGCRFCFTKGVSTVVVIEQDPQIRSLLFGGDMLGDRHEPEREAAVERIALALPYVVFVLHFKSDVFVNLYCAWRTSPIKSLDATLIQPLLPNIHEGFSVCMGRTYTSPEGSIADKTDSALSNFWNSQFNNDLGVNWWGKGRVDQRLRSARTWAQHSLDDSTFILSVALRDVPNRTIKYLIDLVTMHEEEPDENSLRHKLSETIDSSAGLLFNKIIRYFKKTKFDRFDPKDVKEVLARTMKDACGELNDLLFAMQHEINRLGTEVEDCRRPRQVSRAGRLWREYSP